MNDLSYLFDLLLVVNICIILDALRRIARIRLQNKTISTSAVVVFSLMYVAAVIGIVLLQFVWFQSAAIAVEISYAIGMAVLGTILFKIGTQSIFIADAADDFLTTLDTSSVKHGEMLNLLDDSNF